MDAIEKAEPRVFAIGDAVIAEREADLAQLESVVRTLSNGPLLASAGLPSDSPPSAESDSAA